jgi:hypothetical protein
MNDERTTSLLGSWFIVPRSSFRVLLGAILGAVAVLAGLAVGCTKKEARYPADHARYERIDQAVEAIRAAYEKKDLSRFQTLLLSSEQLGALESQVRSDFDQFQAISLDITIDRIVIGGETIDVFVHWQGLWQRNQADTGHRERGHGKLRLVGEQTVLLRSVEGDLPFGMAIRRPPVETPANKPSG